MTSELNIMANAGNFFSIKTLLGDMIRRIDYPEPYDSSYMFVADVPDNMIGNIRECLKTIRKEG